MSDPELAPAALGLRDEHVAALARLVVPGGDPGRVSRVDRGRATVLTAGGPVRAATTVPRQQAEGDPDGPPAVGDWVVVGPTPLGPGVVRVLPRSTAFVRRDPGAETVAQVVAANVDVVGVTAALDAVHSLRRLERYLAAAWDSGARPVVLLTKADACPDVDAAVADAGRVAVGVDVHAVSALTGEGMEAISALVAPGLTVALIGSSGAGKSTLANRLLGREAMHVDRTRRDAKGRHTTTHRELLPLPGGGVLIDTPGLRTLVGWGGEEGLARTFADVAELAEECRFANCAHAGEPGCAVARAVAEGTLAAERVAALRKLEREQEAVERQKDVRLRQEAGRRYRILARSMRQRDRLDGRRR